MPSSLEPWADLEALVRAAEAGDRAVPAELQAWLRQHREQVAGLASELQGVEGEVSEHLDGRRGFSRYPGDSPGSEQPIHGAVIEILECWLELLKSMDHFHERLEGEILADAGLASPKTARQRVRIQRRLQRANRDLDDLRKLR